MKDLLKKFNFEDMEELEQFLSDLQEITQANNIEDLQELESRLKEFSELLITVVSFYLLQVLILRML